MKIQLPIDTSAVTFIVQPVAGNAGTAIGAGFAAGYFLTPRDRDEAEEMWEKIKEKFASIGKAPQHPTMHNLYREDDMLAFLRSAPAPS